MKNWLKSAFMQWVCRSANPLVILGPIEKETPALHKAGVSFSIVPRVLFKLFGLLKGSALEVSISLVEDLDPVTGNLGYK